VLNTYSKEEGVIMKYSIVKVCTKEQPVTVSISSDKKPNISEIMVKKWQDIIDLLSLTIKVPSALIMRLEEKNIEIFLASNTKDNPYKIKEKAELISGLYCETVVGNKSCLLVPNALKDPLWRENPDIKLNMISYLGLPILWADGEVFGTLCILDNKENHYNNQYIKLMELLKDSIEKDLQLIFEEERLKKELENRKIAEQKLRESETRYRELFNNMRSAVVIYDVKDEGNKFVFADLNKSAELIEKIDKVDIIGKDVEECFPGASEMGLLKIMKEVWKTGIAHYLGPTFYKDNKINGWRENYYIYKLNSEQVVVIYDDISEKIEYQKIINENERLICEKIEYDKVRNEFFANISHELRTPLNVILSALQLIELKQSELNHSNAFMVKYIKIMEQNCFRLVRLINNIIEMTKINTDYFEIHFQNIDIVALTREITSSVTAYISNRGVKLSFYSEIEKSIASLDADKIETILLNLLSNAVKFTEPDDSIAVTISKRNEWIAISVKDTGSGIPEDKLEVIFERFRQVDKSLTRNHEGSGIGLSLVKALVEKHNGKISVQSDYGKGSEFIVELPDVCLSDELIKPNTIKYNLDNDRIKKINIEFSDIYSL
jgi:signal transduction histidine kinase/regulator of replication initiation timing